ncbi:MAG: hypothetical protein Q8888_02080 [Vigna little leaf phytoplasma]|nr:hypothetical protein [Vigna little leaf phytoplasma]
MSIYEIPVGYKYELIDSNTIRKSLVKRELTCAFFVLKIEFTFSTTNTNYIIQCSNKDLRKQIVLGERQKMQNWLNSCPIRSNQYYSGREIRNKFGRYSQNLYDEEGRIHRYSYIDGWFYDDWYIDNRECSRTYPNYLHTICPPIIPETFE